MSPDEDNFTEGARDTTDVHAKDTYLTTGKVPLSYVLRRGVVSLLTDPWRTIVQNLTGPVGFRIRQRYYRRKLGRMGKGVVIDPGVDISGTRNVYLDDFCYLGRRTQLVAPEGYIKIGKRCHIVSWIIGHGGVEIGNYVGCGGNLFSATDSHQGGYRMAGPMIPPEQRNIRYGKIVIEDDAFIGQHSIILPGVTIGQGAVIGPHTLVVRDVAPWTVVMGSPPRIIGKREPVKFPDPD